jgi:uncharacterized protein YbjT (DUF2867 family)
VRETLPAASFDSSVPSLPKSAAGKRELVFGASGYVGTHLVARLLAEGRVVRAAARSRKVLEARGWRGVELVEADALQPATLTPALDGVDVAYYLVHSMAAGRDFGRIDLEAAENFARAAAAAGVRRIVYLGGLLPDAPDSEHLTSRRDTGERLRSGPVPVTEIRAGIIVGAGSAAYEVIRDLVNNLPVMATPRWVRSKSSPIALANLLEYLVRVPHLDAAAGRIYDAGGPDFLSYEDMMRQFGAAVGRRPRIVRVPVLTPTLSSYWLGLVTTVPANIAKALIGGMKHDLPARDASLRALVPQRLLSYGEALEAALAAERSNAVAARWTEGVMMFRSFRQDHAYYAKRAGGSAVTDASPEAVWRVVCAIGGHNRYFYMNFLWWIREAMDWLVGGPGFTRGRRDPGDVRLGDSIDYWTVIGVEPARRLTLDFGMKAPGSGILEFEIEPLDGGRTRLTETAYWHPRGIWGLAYWWVLVPAHLFIFKGMTAAMARRAEAREARRP